MTYSGVPEPVISAGFPTGWLTTDEGGVYVIGEPDGGATWFPSNDHPSDKATLALEATVPRGWVVAANGAFEGRRRDGAAVTWAWSEDDPIATYLVTVAIDQFRIVEEETDSGLPLVSFYPEADADRLTEAFADAGDMIEAFEEAFGPVPVRRVRGHRHPRAARLRARDPDPFDVRHRRRVHRRVPGPRAGPPVVRRLHDPAAVGGHLAQRGLRHLRRDALVGGLRAGLRHRRRRRVTGGTTWPSSTRTRSWIRASTAGSPRPSTSAAASPSTPSAARSATRTSSRSCRPGRPTTGTTT